MERGNERVSSYGIHATLIIAFCSLSHQQVGSLLRAIFHAEYGPLPRIVYFFVGKWTIYAPFKPSISHPFHTHLKIHPSHLQNLELFFSHIQGNRTVPSSLRRRRPTNVNPD